MHVYCYMLLRVEELTSAVTVTYDTCRVTAELMLQNLPAATGHCSVRVTGAGNARPVTFYFSVKTSLQDQRNHKIRFCKLHFYQFKMDQLKYLDT